jgi:hypothetical protein
MTDMGSSPKGVINSPWKLFRGKSKRSTAISKKGNDVEPDNDKVRMRRTLSKIKEQEETIFLQIQSKINPNPSFDVIRTISMQDDKKEKKKFFKKTHHSTSESNQKAPDADNSQTQDRVNEMFHVYHEKLHSRPNSRQSQFQAVHGWKGTGQNLFHSSDVSSCHISSDGSVYSSHDDDDDDESCASSEKSFAEYTVDSSMSSVTVPMAVRTDSVTTSELFSLISTCAADAAAKLGNMCIYADEEEGTKVQDNIPSKMSEITIPNKSKK